MTKRSIQDTRRFHLLLYRSDLDYLERRFGIGAPSAHRLGVGTACREIIHERVKKLRAKENERLNKAVQVVEYDLEEGEDLGEELEDAE